MVILAYVSMMMPKDVSLKDMIWTGLLQNRFLQHPHAKIIHDPRLTWNTQNVVKTADGIPIKSKTGHAFIKERMRAENALTIRW